MSLSSLGTMLSTDNAIILLAIASAFIGSSYLVCMSRVMKREHAPSSLQVLVLSHFLAALALLPFMKSNDFGLAQNSSIFLLVIAAAGFLVISRMLYFYAYARTDVATVAIFSPLTPIYVLLTGYILLGETATFNEVAGLMVISLSIYVYFMRKGTSLANIANWLEPFRQIARSRAVLCAFLSTIPTAFAAIFQKELLLNHTNPVAFSFWLLLLIALIAGVILMFKRSSVKLVSLTTLPISFYAASLILLPLTHVLFSWLVLAKPTAIALVLQRTGIIFQIMLAYFIMHEREQIGRRIAISLFIILGFSLIMLY